MQITVLQENLNKGLSTVGRLVSTKTQLPILNNILLATDNGRLRLSATNLETGINYWVGAKVDKEGSITIPSRVLSEFVSGLSSEKATLVVNDLILTLECGSTEATFNGVSASEFPLVPVLSGSPSFSFDPMVFVDAVSRVAFSAATDEGRQVLTGVKWIIKNGEFTMAATDGYRLSLKKFPISIKKEKENATELLIPAKALMEMVKILGEVGQKKEKDEKREDLKVQIMQGENQVLFEANDVGLVTRLLEGQYPNFEKIIPGSSTTKTTIDTAELLRGVRVASIFARDSANLIKFSIETDHITITANAPQVGQNITTIEAKTEGGPGEIAFNSRYLLDFLNITPTEQIILETSGSLKPGVFRFVGDDSFLHIIMPVRVQ
jgi:DNA polymerase III subunit beta